MRGHSICFHADLTKVVTKHANLSIMAVLKMNGCSFRENSSSISLVIVTNIVWEKKMIKKIIMCTHLPLICQGKGDISAVLQIRRGNRDSLGIIINISP